MLGQAADLGARLAQGPFERLFFVACGAQNRAMAIAEYWAQGSTAELCTRRFYPATLIHQAPRAVDERTLVLLGSHSGSTQETLAAAEWVRSRPSAAVGVTQRADSPLARRAEHTLAYGETRQGYYASYLVIQAFLSGFLEGRGLGSGGEKTLNALAALPGALADAMDRRTEAAAAQARALKEHSRLYVIGGGPAFHTAYVVSVCVLMEMQRLHAHPLAAAEFFHGPLEVFDGDTPALLLLGEDPSRPEAERVLDFCETVGVPTTVYDSREDPMPGIPEEMRPLASPFLLDAALIRLAEHLAEARGHPMTLRRYMGKMEY
jgi:fructoselysine 6-phosphate deglycase